MPLFASLEPDRLTITADFKTVQRDRDVDSKTLYPGTLAIAKDGVAGPPIPIQLRTRGHVRRNTRVCEFAPLRLEFPKAGVKDTVFDGLDFVRLGTHCQTEDVYQQYTLKEYLATRLLLTLTPRGLRVAAGAGDVRRHGRRQEALHAARHLLRGPRRPGEADGGARAAGPAPGLQRRRSAVVAVHVVLPVHDRQHRLLDLFAAQRRDHRRHQGRPVRRPYDFDYSGLVYAHYATPARGSAWRRCATVCTGGRARPRRRWSRRLQPFREKQAELLALPASLPGLDEGHRRNAEKYLNEFFELISKPDKVKRTFVTGCKPLDGM